MLIGKVSSELEALATIHVVGPLGERRVEAVIDTGFNGYLVLSTPLVTELGLKLHSVTAAELGDGSIVPLRKYEAAIKWDGFSAARDAFVLCTDGGALIGMSLLRGSRVTISVVPGGDVGVTPLALE